MMSHLGIALEHCWNESKCERVLTRIMLALPMPYEAQVLGRISLHATADDAPASTFPRASLFTRVAVGGLLHDVPCKLQ